MINIKNLFKRKLSIKDFYLKNEELLNTLPNKESLYELCLKENIHLISYNDGKLTFKTHDGVFIQTDKYYWIFQQIFLNKNYEFPKDIKFKKYSVFEVGSNRGESTLWFAKDKKCVNIYGFEIDPDTIKIAETNKNLNPKLSNKIHLYNFGLSDFNDANYKLTYIPNEDSVSTIEDFFVNDYYTESRKLRLKTKIVEIRNSSEVINSIINEKKINNDLVLEIDAEGTEYKILKDLKETNTLNKFSVIFGECHRGMDEIYQILGNNFKLVKLEEINKQLSNFCFIKIKQ